VLARATVAGGKRQQSEGWDAEVSVPSGTLPMHRGANAIQVAPRFMSAQVPKTRFMSAQVPKTAYPIDQDSGCLRSSPLGWDGEET